MYRDLRETFEREHFRLLVEPKPVCVQVTSTGNMWLLSKRFLCEEHPRSFIDAWLKDPDARAHRYVDFLPPPLSVPEGVHNVWRGFAAERLPATTTGSVQPFLEHVSSLAGFDPTARDWFLGWLERLFRSPGDKVPEEDGVVILTGPPGCGKHLFMKFLGELLGDGLVHDDPREGLFLLTAGTRKHRLIVHVSYKLSPGDLTRIRALAAGETTEYKQARMPSLRLTNRARFVITTSKDSTADWTGLRVLRCLPKDMTDMGEYYGDPANQRAVYDWLMGRG